ncbi:PTS sugar transporter subunit IIA [Xylocopilactobacillus apis]|uniref:PTS fructose transporter subunit IIA n=1 Tax=Xylocopilactobacillus apis TaxID=2932183 RepID=A0AAU9CTL4_9LACO|nr:PTS fructose transporter subunit IIA [Xylocopilactobacillus apis]BDR57359.1 PTS fructose transporter subunit IIA [Xylocopilactobacillus apis]
MKQLILISHGNFCVELKKSAEMIMGPQENIHAVPLLPEDGQGDFLNKFNETVKDMDDYVVFADLMGGTPANTVSKEIMRGKKIQLYAGVNLPMVIEFVNSTMINQSSTYVDVAKDGIVNVNDVIAGNDDDEDE